MFRTLTPLPFSGCASGLVGQNILVDSFCATYTEDREGVSARNIGKPYILTHLFPQENHAISKFLFLNSLYSKWTR